MFWIDLFMLEFEPNWLPEECFNVFFLASNLVWLLTDFMSISTTMYFHCQLFSDEDNMHNYPKIYFVCIT